jgi:hypothetical protein
MQQVLVMRHNHSFVALVVVIVLGLLVSACSNSAVNVGVGVQPLDLPVKFAANFTIHPDGSIAVGGSAGIVTEAGIFSIDANVETNLHPKSDQTLLIVRHYLGDRIVDSVFRIATAEEIIVELNGLTVVHVLNRKILIDASSGQVKHLTVTNSPALAAPSIQATTELQPPSHPSDTSQRTAPPHVAGDVAPGYDPGQVPIPDGATILGPVNLQSYCQRNWSKYAVLRFPNTWGWRCSTSPIRASGERLGDTDVSVNDACAQQYGAGSVSHYRAYYEADSWLCYHN